MTGLECLLWPHSRLLDLKGCMDGVSPCPDLPPVTVIVRSHAAERADGQSCHQLVQKAELVANEHFRCNRPDPGHFSQSPIKLRPGGRRVVIGSDRAEANSATGIRASASRCCCRNSRASLMHGANEKGVPSTTARKPSMERISLTGLTDLHLMTQFPQPGTDCAGHLSSRAAPRRVGNQDRRCHVCHLSLHPLLANGRGLRLQQLRKSCLAETRVAFR